jgi:hypothetical protein
MLKGSFFGLKAPAAALALLLTAAGLYFGPCSSDKGEKKEQVDEETVEVEVETPEEPEVTAAPKTGEGADTSKQEEGMPSEITEPCSGKNEGDACSVATSDGMEISGSCKMTRKNILGCFPQPVIKKNKAIPPGADKTPEPLKKSE